MANWFDEMTKTMADEKLGRRQALRKIAGTVAGAAIAAYIPGSALAKGNSCASHGVTCGGGYVNCPGNSNTNCYCFQKDGKKGACGCNQYCSTSTACTNSSSCPKGYFCATGTCCSSPGPNICVAKCAGANKNCILKSGHAGSTAAH